MKFRSLVNGSGDANLGDAFPTYLPEPERMVYDAVEEATAWTVRFPDDAAVPVGLPAFFGNPPAVSFYAGRTDGPTIPVVRGWPAYPGKIPAIGVALGAEGEDDQHEVEQGGFAGESFLEDDQGNRIASADYYAEPLYSTIVVELIHENRDERDRLHGELRRVLFPLRRKLPARSSLIRRVRVDSEKQDLADQGERPFVLYVSLFTVAVHFEMLEATNVTGIDGIISSVDPSVDPLALTDLTQVEIDAFQIEASS